ncbi:unnamed protein product, partial [Ostreobium quekettii]
DMKARAWSQLAAVHLEARSDAEDGGEKSLQAESVCALIRRLGSLDKTLADFMR